MNTKLLNRISAFVLLGAIVVSAISLIPDSENIPGFDWATFDRTSSIGPIDYTLKADFDAVGFRYSIGTESSSSGGGIIGGIGGGVGSNITREEDWKAYPQVKGEVLENLGVLYDSYKDKSYTYELLFKSIQDYDITYEGSGSPSAYLNVSLRSDLVPYWPEEGKRTLDVEVTFLGTDIHDQVGSEERSRFEITLEKVTIKARTGYNKDTGEYEGETKVISEKALSESFKEVGDEYVTSLDVGYPEGEEAVGFIVQIDATMNDYWDRSERSPLSGSANPINIRPLESNSIVTGIGIVLAMPVLIISILTGLAASIIILVKGRSMWGLILPSALLSAVGPLWYYLGMRSAVGILSNRLSGAESGLELGPGFFISIAGSFLFLIALGISITAMILNRKEKNSGGGTIATKAAGPATKTDEKGPAPAIPSFRKIENKDQQPLPSFKKIEDRPSNDRSLQEPRTQGSKTFEDPPEKPPVERSITPPPPPTDPFE